MPSMHLTLITDEQPKTSLFDKTVILENPKYHFMDKIRGILQSPYQKTLFVDTDTYFCGEVSGLFDLLDHFDLSAAHAPARETYSMPEIPPSFTEFNSGVIVYRDSKEVQACFADWLEYYRPFQDKKTPNDQPFLRKALYLSRLRLATLPPEYNCRFILPGYLNQKAKILHGRHPNLGLVEETINKTHSKRVHVVEEDSLVVYEQNWKVDGNLFKS